MSVWKSLSNRWYLTFPYTNFVGFTDWGFSRVKCALQVSEDSYIEYSILHVGPFEFFTRKRTVALDFF